ncbi:MAG: TRZ/ATZ family hydrolase [Gammaproteobacteria bacterium]|jgi:5-methylthioadenosine/S-adenosylhomocysteine deaminase
MQQADFIVEADWIIPVEPAGQVLAEHAVVVKDGRIVELAPAHQAARRYPEAKRVSRPGHVLMPGLVNAHTHAAMSLLRGLADDLPLMTWLKEHIWPAESRWVSADFVRDGTELAVAEMLRGGTTCFNDMYFFPDMSARTAQRYGIRASVGMIVIDFPSPWADNPGEYLRKGMRLRDEYRGDPLLSFVFAPHAPYTVSDAGLGDIRKYADELDVPVHMHVHETAHEVADALKAHGQRPLARLDVLGLVNPGFMAVHMTQLEDAEIARMAETGASVIHCPESNLKLASGFCPVARLVRAGVNVGLGTDGAASNNDLDMFGEMRTAALLAKGVAGDAAALPAEQALRMATLYGARALGLGDQIGSLEAGKWADMITVNMEAPATRPLYHPISQLVYAASRDQVGDVWVAGRQLLRDGNLTQMNTESLRQRSAEWRRRIAAADEGETE